MSTSSRTASAVLAGAAVAGLGALAWGVLVERNRFTVRHELLPVLPRGARPLTVLHLSDLHMAPWQTAKQDFIRSLAVYEHAKTKGVGRELIEALVAEAELYELDAVFAFTYVVEFFNRVGFHVVERGALPLKAWKDCVRCPKFQACDEIAVLRILRPDHWAESEPQPWGPIMTSPSDELIQIPTPRQP